MERPPKDKSKPFTINGILFANRKEYDLRVKQDTKNMALYLYDLYKRRKDKQKDEVQ